jgi:hypothetical protein
MARGTTLTVLLQMLNAEVGNSGATNATRDTMYSTVLSNIQKWLVVEDTWAFLEQRWDVVAPANTQFLNFPTTDIEGNTCAFDLTRYPLVEVYWTNTWQSVRYGIGADEYNTLDFTLAQQSDPIQNWRVSSNNDEATGANQFEVWPVPVTPQKIRFTANRVLLPLAAPTDVCDLDDLLIVLFAAAEILKRNKQPDYEEKAGRAKRYLAWLRQNYPSRDVKRCLGGSEGSDFKDSRKLAGMIIMTK